MVTVVNVVVVVNESQPPLGVEGQHLIADQVEDSQLDFLQASKP